MSSSAVDVSIHISAIVVRIRAAAEACRSNNTLRVHEIFALFEEAALRALVARWVVATESTRRCSGFEPMRRGASGTGAVLTGVVSNIGSGGYSALRLRGKELAYVGERGRAGQRGNGKKLWYGATVVEKLMGEDLIKIWTLRRI